MAGGTRGRDGNGEPPAETGAAGAAGADARSGVWPQGGPVDEIPTPAWLLDDEADGGDGTGKAGEAGRAADAPADGPASAADRGVTGGGAVADEGARVRVAPEEPSAGPPPWASPAPAVQPPPEPTRVPPQPPVIARPPRPAPEPEPFRVLPPPADVARPPWTAPAHAPGSDAPGTSFGGAAATTPSAVDDLPGEPPSATGLFGVASPTPPAPSCPGTASADDALPPPVGEPWGQFAPPPPRSGPEVGRQVPPIPPEPPAGPEPQTAFRWDTAAVPDPDTESDPDTEPDPFPAAAYAEQDEPRLSVTPWRAGEDGETTVRESPGSGRFGGRRGDEDPWDGQLRRPPLFRRLVVATVVFAVLVGAFIVLALVNRGDDDNDSPPPTDPPRSAARGGEAVFPAAAPEGWSRTAAWTVRVTAPAEGAAPIAATTEAVAVVTPERKVALLDPATGRVLRTFALPPGEYRGIKVTDVDGVASVLAHCGDRLVYAPADGSAEPTTLDVPASATVVHGGRSPLVVADPQVFVIRDGRMSEVRMPPGATAMGADGETVIAVDPAGRWWNVRPGQDAVEVRPVPPRRDAAVVRMAAAGHNTVAVLWTGPNDAAVTAVLHDAATGQPQISTDVPREQMEKTAWVWGADGHVAALGALVFDLDARKAHVRSGFGPVIGWGNLLYGHNTDDPRTALAIDATDPTRPAIPLGQGVPLPWGGPTGDLILILDTRDSTAPTLYALNPEGSSPRKDPSPGTPGTDATGPPAATPAPGGTP
ncbi:hypothetical protein [Yinghuangia sp. YIM S10712]|uniref:hypothetical protein n=1 Tax=Yinghuangia sp. YIM S10712 TaxID=3436930 RepID=UPI003F5303AF